MFFIRRPPRSRSGRTLSSSKRTGRPRNGRCNPPTTPSPSRTSLLKITVTRKDGAIAYAEVNGGSLVQEASRRLTPEKVNGEDTYRAESFVNIYGSHEGLYGLGQHQAGVWNYRGESVDISQENSNISVPLMLSSKGYGIFWNNTSRSRFNNRFANYLYISSEVADVIDYYFLYGPDFDKIIAGYRDLTGQAPMFGKWAYGFWQCKNRYKSQDEILGVARKYRDLHIPVDNIVQDWFWWNRKGEFVFNKNYPDPKAMVDQLARRKFPPDDFDLAVLRAGLGELRLHAEQGLVRRQVQVREAALPHRCDGRV